MCDNSKSRDQYDAVICTVSVTFCTHWSSEGEAADNEKLHNNNNTAGNKGKVLQLVEKDLFSGVLTGGIFLCSVFNISQLFEK